MPTRDPLLRAAAVTIDVIAGGGTALARVRALSGQHASLEAGALLAITGGPAIARLAVLEVLSGRRGPTAGSVMRTVPDTHTVRLVVSTSTGVLLVRSWAHLPGAARAGRARARPGDGLARLHFVFADGPAPADRPRVGRLLEGVRDGDGIVLALPSAEGVPATVRQRWSIDALPCVAALSRAS
jgi:hypothetical protein